MRALSPALQAALLMTSAAAITAFQNALIRLLSDSGIHPFEIAFFRSSFGFVAMAVVMLVRERAWPRTAAMRSLGASSLFHLAAMLSFFYGLSLVPLADSAALTFTAPLFGTLAAAFFLGEKVHARRWVAITIGFVGVLIVVRPGVVPFSLGPGLVLFSTVAFAGVTVLVKRMAATERTTTVVFYQSLFMSFLTVPPAAMFWSTPSPFHFLLLVGLGALSTVGWLCFTRAFALADASAILPLEFTRLPFVAVLGYVIFAEVPDIWVWVGAVVIFGSSLSIAHRENAAARKG
ncbi:MAG: DMT family transporter [Alphaproteobacteria bacterium]|nr:DMT family transporter [Alphaproteobacteria bacterium]